MVVTRLSCLIAVWQQPSRQRYLHDGRAATLRDAILAHSGEGEIVRNRYFDLGEADKQAILSFLGGL
jgi:CxxC motif-containing protein (DUF1111 family)